MSSLESLSESVKSPCVSLFMQLTWELSVKQKQKLCLVYTGQLGPLEEPQCSFFQAVFQYQQEWSFYYLLVLLSTCAIFVPSISMEK